MSPLWGEGVCAVCPPPRGDAPRLLHFGPLAQAEQDCWADHRTRIEGAPSPQPMLASPSVLRRAVIATSPNCRGGICQMCGFISSTDTAPA